MSNLTSGFIGFCIGVSSLALLAILIGSEKTSDFKREWFVEKSSVTGICYEMLRISHQPAGNKGFGYMGMSPVEDEACNE